MHSSRPALLRRFLAIFVISSIGIPQAALSQSEGEIIGGFIGIIVQGAAVNAAKKSWAEVTPEIQACLRNSYGIDPEELIKRGIQATDKRVAPYVDACRKQIQENRLKQARIIEAQRAWGQVAVDVLYCLRNRHHIDPNQLAQQGVMPNDGRVEPYISACKSELAEKLRQKEEAAMREQQRLQAEERAREEAILREQRKREARVADLNSRFPAEWADKILAGEIDFGWSMEAVRESLGEPREKTNTPDGSEMWTYDHVLVVFTNGEVTYIGEI